MWNLYYVRCCNILTICFGTQLQGRTRKCNRGRKCGHFLEMKTTKLKFWHPSIPAPKGARWGNVGENWGKLWVLADQIAEEEIPFSSLSLWDVTKQVFCFFGDYKWENHDFVLKKKLRFSMDQQMQQRGSQTKNKLVRQQYEDFGLIQSKENPMLDNWIRWILVVYQWYVRHDILIWLVGRYNEKDATFLPAGKNLNGWPANGPYWTINFKKPQFFV